MKKSPYNGKHVDLNEIRHLYNVLKFYYDDSISHVKRIDELFGELNKNNKK